MPGEKEELTKEELNELTAITFSPQLAFSLETQIHRMIKRLESMDGVPSRISKLISDLEKMSHHQIRDELLQILIAMNGSDKITVEPTFAELHYINQVTAKKRHVMRTDDELMFVITKALSQAIPVIGQIDLDDLSFESVLSHYLGSRNENLEAWTYFYKRIETLLEIEILDKNDWFSWNIIQDVIDNLKKM